MGRVATSLRLDKLPGLGIVLLVGVCRLILLVLLGHGHLGRCKGFGFCRFSGLERRS